MVTRVKIENFKGIKSATLDNLKPINVIVGRNGYGKTTLLEAIYLLCGGSPELLFRTRAWRGAGETAQINSAPEMFSSKAASTLFPSNCLG